MTSTVVEPRYRVGPLLAATVTTLLVTYLLWRLVDVLLLVFIAALVAMYLGSVTDFFVGRLRIPRRLAFVAAVLLTIGGVVGLGALLVPPLVQQTRQLASVLPDYIRAWQDMLTRLFLRYPALGTMPPQQDVVGAVVTQLRGAVTGVFPTVLNIGHTLVNIVSILVMGIYLALYPGLYREWLIALFPPVHRDVVRDVLGDIRTTLRAWIAAQALAMTILGTLTAIGLYALRVPYALTFGVFTGVVVIIPFFGTLLGTLLPALFVLGGPGYNGLGPSAHFFLVLGLGVFVHIVEGNVVVPLVTARRVEIPPVLGMLSVLIVGRLLGIGAVIVSVPLIAVVMVLIRRILIHRVYEGQQFRRAPRDRVLVVRAPAPDGNVVITPREPVDVLRSATHRVA